MPHSANSDNPAGDHIFKGNNRNTKTRCIILPYSTVSIVNFEQVNADWQMAPHLVKLGNSYFFVSVSLWFKVHGNVFFWLWKILRYSTCSLKGLAFSPITKLREKYFGFKHFYSFRTRLWKSVTVEKCTRGKSRLI